MPELPEVETMRRGVLPIVGSTISGVARTPCPRKPILIAPRIDRFRRRAVGRRIVDVRRAGKRVLVAIDSGDAIVFEPRMTGLVLIADPPDEQYLRVKIDLQPPRTKKRPQKHSSLISPPDSCLPNTQRSRNRAPDQSAPPPHELLFWDRRGLGSVRLLSPAEQTAAFGPPRLGPDALEITCDELAKNLGLSRRAIKVALLDQTAVAGIGNLYASEMLHLAAIHPATPCQRLRRGQWSALHAAMGEVLHDAIAHEGSTLSDGTYRNALNRDGGYQHHHRAYDREGEPCRRCRTATIRRIVQAQRSTFFCPRCQTRRPSATKNAR